MGAGRPPTSETGNHRAYRSVFLPDAKKWCAPPRRHRTDSSERQHTLRALSQCTKLETLTLTYVVFNKETPDLPGLIELLAHLSSPSLSTVTISVRAEPHWPVSLPDYCYVGKPEVLQFAELCLPSWAGVAPLLTKSRWPGMKRIVIRAHGDEVALRDFLQTCCPALLQVFILEVI